MHKGIINILKKLEKDRNIKILFAVEAAHLDLNRENSDAQDNTVFYSFVSKYNPATIGTNALN